MAEPKTLMTVTLTEGDERTVEVKFPGGLVGELAATVGFVIPQGQTERDALVGILNYFTRTISGYYSAVKNNRS